MEIRWPPNQELPSPNEQSEWFLRLGSASGRTTRAQVTGPLWREDARREDGRWIVPGAVEVFTSRGDRILDVQPEGIVPQGFLVPLPRHPGTAHLEWSDWLPHDSTDEFRYRFRVVPRHRPIRTETYRGFGIGLIAGNFTTARDEAGRDTGTASAEFAITYNGRAVPLDGPASRAVAIATLEGPVPALLALVDAPRGDEACVLVTADGEAATAERIADCGMLKARPLTSDPSTFSRARDSNPPAGHVDRESFATAGLYLLGGAVLDTRTLSVVPLSRPPAGDAIDRIPPLGVSPDERSFVTLAWGESSTETIALAVNRIPSGDSDHLPIDASRMRYADIDQIDPAWVLHYFAWERGADGSDRLVERPNVTPLPHRGVLMFNDPDYREYRWAPAREGLREALIAFLVTEFKGERLPHAASAFAHEVRIGSATVNVSYEPERHHVGLWVNRGMDTRLVLDIGRRFDEALRSGRYDHLFGS